METYPSINTTVINKPIIAFDKLDGSNIRAEWTRKSGFSKFGTRRRLLDPEEKPLGEAVELFLNTYADDLERVFRKERLEKTTAFFEFYGANSFAGFHEDEEHEVTLFDLHVYKKGMLAPNEFLKMFKNIKVAEVLYEGKATAEFIESVRNSTLPGMTCEGVVCKGELDSRRRPLTFKIKSQIWFDKLSEKYGHDSKLLDSLR
jgi:hypothetical protein